MVFLCPKTTIIKMKKPTQPIIFLRLINSSETTLAHLKYIKKWNLSQIVEGKVNHQKSVKDAVWATMEKIIKDYCVKLQKGEAKNFILHTTKTYIGGIDAELMLRSTNSVLDHLDRLLLAGLLTSKNTDTYQFDGNARAITCLELTLNADLVVLTRQPTQNTSVLTPDAPASPQPVGHNDTIEDVEQMLKDFYAKSEELMMKKSNKQGEAKKTDNFFNTK